VRLFNGKQNASQMRRRALASLISIMRLLEGDSFLLPPSLLPSTLFLQVVSQLARAWPLVEHSSIPFVARLPLHLAKIIPFDRTCHRKPRVNPPLPPSFLTWRVCEYLRPKVSEAEMTHSEPEARAARQSTHSRTSFKDVSGDFPEKRPAGPRAVHASIYPLLHRSLQDGPEIHDKAASTHSRGYTRDREERACG